MWYSLKEYNKRDRLSRFITKSFRKMDCILFDKSGVKRSIDMLKESDDIFSEVYDDGEIKAFYFFSYIRSPFLHNHLQLTFMSGENINLFYFYRYMSDVIKNIIKDRKIGYLTIELTQHGEKMGVQERAIIKILKKLSPGIKHSFNTYTGKIVLN